MSKVILVVTVGAISIATLALQAIRRHDDVQQADSLWTKVVPGQGVVRGSCSRVPPKACWESPWSISPLWHICVLNTRIKGCRSFLLTGEITVMSLSKKLARSMGLMCAS